MRFCSSARDPVLAPVVVATIVVVGAVAPDARALDKQGAAHQGQGSGDGDDAPLSAGFQLSGKLFLGILPYNLTYPARPDNTGPTTHESFH